MMVPFGFEDKL